MLNSEQTLSNKRRKLEDSELDSGDDEGRGDRAKRDSDGEEDIPERTAVITDIAIGHHPGPLPSDGEVCSLTKIHQGYQVLSKVSFTYFNFLIVLESIQRHLRWKGLSLLPPITIPLPRVHRLFLLLLPLTTRSVGASLQKTIPKFSLMLE